MEKILPWALGVKGRHPAPRAAASQSRNAEMMCVEK
jgi:hypothetical protein